MPKLKRPCQDPEQFYAYVWRLDGEVIWVGQGHSTRGVPSRKNTVGRPKQLARVLDKRWYEIKMEAFPCDSQQQARDKEVELQLALTPKYNTAVGFAGFAGRKHSKKSKSLIRASSLGRPASELCKQKSSQRMTERNRVNPPRKGKKCSDEHRRKLSEAAKRRYAKCT